MTMISIESAIIHGTLNEGSDYRLLLYIDGDRTPSGSGVNKSSYIEFTGANIVGWSWPFGQEFKTNASEKSICIALREKRGLLDVRGREVCSFALDNAEPCQSRSSKCDTYPNGTRPTLSVNVSMSAAPANETKTSTESASQPQTAPNTPRVKPSRPSSKIWDSPSLSELVRGSHYVISAITDPASASNAVVDAFGSLTKVSNEKKDPIPPQADVAAATSAMEAAALDVSALGVKSLPFSFDRVQNVPLDDLQNAGSIALEWSGILDLDAIVKFIDVTSDIHPFVKIAWSLVSAAYKIAKTQAALDGSIQSLVDAMDSNCRIVKSLASLKLTSDVEVIVRSILREVMNGAEIIKVYCEKRPSVLSSIKTLVSNLQAQTDGCIGALNQFRKELSDFTLIATQRDVQELAARLTETLKRFDKVENYIQSQEESALLNEIPYAPTADRALRSRDQGCLPGTRSEVIDDILGWALGMRNEGSAHDLKGLQQDSRVLWLCGVAGSGKSSIAISVAKTLHAAGRLGALYGFESALQATLNPTNLFSTIARQLANRKVARKRQLLRILEQTNPDLRGSTSAAEQFERFLCLRDSQVTALSDDVVVIDAFDESGTPSARREALLSLLKLCSSLSSGIRIIVTSRPDPDIQAALDRFQSAVTLLRMDDIPTLQTERDIHAYLVQMLADVPGLQGCDTAGELTQLAMAAEHSFQWASASSRFIRADDDDAAYLPLDRLRHILRTRGGLDDLYLTILNRYFASGLESGHPSIHLLHALLGTLVCAREPLSIDSVAALGTPASPIPDASVVQYHQVAQKLSSIVSGTHDTSTPLLALHTSFTDFLADRSRSGCFAIDRPAVQRQFSMGSLWEMTRLLQPNICKLDTSFLLNSQVPDLAQRIKDNIPVHLSYACRFWPYHVAQAADSPDFPAILDALLVWLEDPSNAMEWLEVMSVTKKPAIHILLPLYYLDLPAGYERLTRAISDLVSFCTHFIVPLSTSASHIYLSALPFAPRSSFFHSFRNTVKIVKGHPQFWPQNMHCLGHASEVLCSAVTPDNKWSIAGLANGEIGLWETPRGTNRSIGSLSHPLAVTSVAFSPDGKILASGSEDRTVRLWKSGSWLPVTDPFQGHTAPVTSVAWSPDSKLVASASRDGTIRLWDPTAETLAEARVLTHGAPLTSVAFSPDGKLIASGSEDATIRLWDAHLLTVSNVHFQGHESSVTAVSFSANGDCLASASTDHTIRLWSIETGQLVGPPLRGHDGAVTSVVFSPVGVVLASASEDKTVRLWNTQTGSGVGKPLEGHHGPVTSLHFTPSGKALGSGSRDGTMRSWEVCWEERCWAPASEATVPPSRSTADCPPTNSLCELPPRLCANIDPLSESPLTFKDGWYLGPHGELLLWVPPLFRSGFAELETRELKNLGSQSPLNLLDFSNFVCGSDWHHCYDL